jgi:hypothetical protein
VAHPNVVPFDVRVGKLMLRRVPGAPLLAFFARGGRIDSARTNNNYADSHEMDDAPQAPAPLQKDVQSHDMLYSLSRDMLYSFYSASGFGSQRSTVVERRLFRSSSRTRVWQ